MEAVQAYYDGNVFVPIAPIKARINQQAIVTILDTNLNDEKPEHKWYDAFFGILQADDYVLITEALKDTEKVDVDEW